MKSKIILLVVLPALLFGSCQLRPEEKGSTAGDSTASSAGPVQPGTDRSADEPAANGTVPGVDRKAILMENSATMQFDGQTGDEVFKVTLLGDSLLGGTVAFTITNGDGELIYTDEFPATMLAATYDESVNTPEKQEAQIKERINAFFEAERFKEPAIQGDQPPHDSYFIDKATYDNLKVTDAPGFVYVIGKENGKYIAWSPLQQKVVMYFNCC